MFLFNDLLLLAKKKRYDYYYINLANPAAQNVGHSTRIVFFFDYYDDFNCLKTTPFITAHSHIAYIWESPPPPSFQILPVGSRNNT